LNRNTILLVLGLCGGACGAPQPPPHGAGARAPLILANGQKLNGQKLNGQKLNGQVLNDMWLVGVFYAATEAAGAPVRRIRLDTTEFSGEAGEKPLSGAAFVGATFAGVTSSKTIVPLFVRSIVRGEGAHEEMSFYEVEYEAGDAWLPLCGVDAEGAPVLAVPVAGRWDLRVGVPGGGSYQADPVSFTFACMDGAIGKCIDAGYKPWRSAPGFESLSEHLEACTRLIRADYCGDGRSWTTDGRLVDLYDGVGVQLDSGLAWPFESAWTRHGAACMKTERFQDTTQPQPMCLSDLHGACEATPFSGAVLLKNRYSTTVLQNGSYTSASGARAEAGSLRDAQ
jgi:hypothetical protein